MAALLAKALAMAVLVHTPCPWVAPVGGVIPVSCAEPPATVYLEPGAGPGELNHELGHLIDFNLLTNADRGRFTAFVRQLDLWWLSRSERAASERAVGGWADGANSTREKFAEAVRMCARSTRFPTNYGAYDWLPTVALHRRVCRWMATLG